ncbi:MAG: glycosyltransferase [Proteobacteria bacterium]|nr:glycosyltransferase [Pseudomonadota bacterium]MBU4294855.1 glycosyltransferase [Pseudomonadota bacterium]MCG2749357.1 glycosyltransferase [Desulfobulbaceae bacterium]
MKDTGGEITILHVWSSFKGDYPLFNQIVHGLKDGFRHIVCYLVGPPSDKETLGKAGFDIRWLPFGNGDLRSFKYRVVRELDQIIKAEGVDIIHAQRHKSVFYAALAARKNSKVRLVTTVHGLNRSRSLLRKIGNRILWPRINKIIAVSEAVKRDILLTNPWFPVSRVEVVYNGIDLAVFGRSNLNKTESRSFFGLPTHGWLWGAVGRLAPVKGHDILLKAWAGSEIGKHGGHLVIAGKGKLRDELTALARELGIANEISLLGHIGDIPKFLTALDGFVMPSRHEGFPLAVLEALAAGLPVVASGVGGIPEILTTLANKGQCFLVPPENDKKLGSAMGQVMAWSELQRNQAVASIKQQAQFFDGNSMIARMDSLYRELMI